MPPHELKLKKNSIVMLLRNLDSNKGLCNGTRLIVKQIYKHLLDCEIISGNYKHT